MVSHGIEVEELKTSKNIRVAVSSLTVCDRPVTRRDVDVGDDGGQCGEPSAFRSSLHTPQITLDTHLHARNGTRSGPMDRTAKSVQTTHRSGRQKAMRQGV